MDVDDDDDDNDDKYIYGWFIKSYISEQNVLFDSRYA